MVVALRGAGLVLGFAVALVLGRTLGVDGYGAYTAGLGLASILAVVLTMGSGPLLVRGTARYRAAGDAALLRGLLTRTVQFVLAGSCVVAAGAAGVLALAGPGSDVGSAMLAGIVLAPLVALTLLAQAVLKGLRLMTAAFAPQLVVRPIAVLAGLEILVLAGRTPSAAGAVALQAAATAAVLLIVVIVIANALAGPLRAVSARYDTAAWRRTAVGLGVSSGLSAITASVGVTVVAALSGGHEAGLLGAATRASILVMVISWASNEALQPVVAHLYAEAEREQLQQQVTTITRWVAAGTLIIAVVVGVLAHPVLRAFGHGFGHGATSLRLLCVAAVVNAVASANMTLLQMTEHERSAAAAAAAGFGVTVALSAALIPWVGAPGAAGAFAAGTIARNVLACRRTLSRLGVESTVIGCRGDRAPPRSFPRTRST
jgi:O-antigen/teichoic acid export membrane protein